MTLSSHAIVGAAIASAMPGHPVIGFILAFASHFVLDAIPHWDYKLMSQKSSSADRDRMNDDMLINRDFFVDLSKIGLDMLLGTLVSLLLFGPFGPLGTHLFWAPLIGVVGGTLPDALQFTYFKWRHEPLVSLQRFHLTIHTKKRLDSKPILGITLQLVVVAIAVVFFKMLI